MCYSLENRFSLLPCSHSGGQVWACLTSTPWQSLTLPVLPIFLSIISYFLLKAPCKQVDYHNYFFALGTNFATWHTET